ncbi:MAG: 4'-phosphopantetheinyl transferase superfamily protein [Treponema sp.]|nr:4'-phosphopantetheinyl transferase superfamily protein [Treponema sp.]
MASYYIGLSCLSINQFSNSERNNALSAEARRILSILTDRPIDSITTEVNGRPFFQNSNIDFNISHSGAAVAVSLVQGENNSENNNGKKVRTGCDIQLIKPRKNLKNITEENFSAAERDYIFSQGETQFESFRFFQIWTLKECYIKFFGFSVFDMPKVPSFIFRDAAGKFQFSLNASDLVDGSSPLSFYLYELIFADERYILAAAIEGKRDIHPEIRIFSQGIHCDPLIKMII